MASISILDDPLHVYVLVASLSPFNGCQTTLLNVHLWGVKNVCMKSAERDPRNEETKKWRTS